MNLTKEQKALLVDMGFKEKHETIRSLAAGKQLNSSERESMEYTFDDPDRPYQDTLTIYISDDPDYFGLDKYVIDFTDYETGEIIGRAFNTFGELLEFMND